MSEDVIGQFIEGTLLGDAYVNKLGVFGFNHSAVQRDYFDHKVALMRDAGFKIRVSEEYQTDKFIDGRPLKPSIKLNARGTKLHKWKLLRERFYPAGKKIVPEDLVLTPLALAYWYMDDGSANMRNKHSATVGGQKYSYTCEPYINQIRLYTDGFDRASQDLLEMKLSEFGITSRHYTRPSGLRFLIIAQTQSKERFKELVLPVMRGVSSMLYKLDRPLRSQFERLSEGTPMNDGRCDSPISRE